MIRSRLQLLLTTCKWHNHRLARWMEICEEGERSKYWLIDLKRTRNNNAWWRFMCWTEIDVRFLPFSASEAMLRDSILAIYVYCHRLLRSRILLICYRHNYIDCAWLLFFFRLPLRIINSNIFAFVCSCERLRTTRKINKAKMKNGKSGSGSRAEYSEFRLCLFVSVRADNSYAYKRWFESWARAVATADGTFE